MGFNSHDIYTEDEHYEGLSRKYFWSSNELDLEYKVLGDVFYPQDEIPCYCYLKNDGTHAMVLNVESQDYKTGEINFITIINLHLLVVDNCDENGQPSSDIEEDSWFKVMGVIATEYRQEQGIFSGKGLTTELYSRIVKSNLKPLVSDNLQYPAGKRVWQKLPQKILGLHKVQCVRYSDVKLLKNDGNKYQFDKGTPISYQEGCLELDKIIWGDDTIHEDHLLIARRYC